MEIKYILHKSPSKRPFNLLRRNVLGEALTSFNVSDAYRLYKGQEVGHVQTI